VQEWLSCMHSLPLPREFRGTHVILILRLISILSQVQHFCYNDLNDTHVNYLLPQCTQRSPLYLLKLLRHQRMPLGQLTVITQAIIVSRILYALPACGRFWSVELCNKINALFRWLKRLDYFSHTVTVSKLLQCVDRYLFYKMCNHSVPCTIRYQLTITSYLW